jgi:D-serine deaminase-like pyridoxal phosphate-dependent protein
MKIAELDTPALVIDLDIYERNLARVADYARQHGLRLRPHTKTHKSPEVARRQLALGAAGLTVAKIGEAEVLMEKLPPTDLLVAFPIFGARKVERLKQLAEKTPVTVALDSLAAAKELTGVNTGVLIEIDVGLGRVGVTPSEALGLAREVQKIPGLRFRGITFYPGHIKDRNDTPAIERLSATISQTVESFRRAGLAPEIVSGGSTPLLYRSHEIEGLNEIRPGTYVFNDLNTIASGACTLEDCAASILVTVVSTPRANTAIVDGGSKTFSSDRLSGSSDVTFGRIDGAPSTRFHKMNEEHGFLDTTKSEREFRTGEKLRIIPNHVCVAVNLHETVYGTRGEEVERSWKVEGRGKLQ